MLKTILKREIQHNLYSLRFILALVLVLGIFVAGTFSFTRGHRGALANYRQAEAQFQSAMKADAEHDATDLAVTRRTYPLRPRDNAFIADAKEKYLPNGIVFSAWNVFGVPNKNNSANPFLNAFEELNWSYIVAMILSFIALLFTFDAVSGEKEDKTLALLLSNSISRGTLLFGKYLSAILTFMAIVIPGIILSLLIVLLSGGDPPNVRGPFRNHGISRRRRFDGGRPVRVRLVLLGGGPQFQRQPAPGPDLLAALHRRHPQLQRLPGQDRLFHRKIGIRLGPGDAGLR